MLFPLNSHIILHTNLQFDSVNWTLNISIIYKKFTLFNAKLQNLLLEERLEYLISQSSNIFSFKKHVPFSILIMKTT